MKIMLSAQGIMIGIDVAMDVIIKELKHLDSKYNSSIKMDMDTISLVLFQRNLIKGKLAFCMGNAVDIMNTFMNQNDPNDKSNIASHQLCILITEKIKELLKDNEKKIEELADIANGQSQRLH